MRLPIRLPLRRGSDAISPTAHYTGHVWSRNGLSDPELATLAGRLLFDALAPAMAVSRALGGPTLEGLLPARHRIIDELLARAIDDGRVSQVLEIASGMSPRGRRFAERYGDGLVYVEAEAAVDALVTAGFAEARLHRADRHSAAGDAASDPAAARIHIIEASTHSRPD